MRRPVKWFLGAVVIGGAVVLGHAHVSAGFQQVTPTQVPVSSGGPPCYINETQCTQAQYDNWKNKYCPKFASLGYTCR